MSLVVIGTVAFDAIETPFGKTDKIVGGAATYASLAASYFYDKTKIVAVVGDDFHQEDIEDFALLFLNNASIQLNKAVNAISSEVLIAFFRHDWPGNLRELQNVIKRATLLNASTVLELESLPSEFNTLEKTATTPTNLKDEAEKSAIVDALNIAKGNKSRAAELLGMSRKTLYNKINQYGLDT